MSQAHSPNQKSPRDTSAESTFNDGQSENEGQIAKFEPGKDGLNFAQYPIVLLTNKQPKIKKLVWQGVAHDPNSKSPIPWKVVVTGSEEHGLPTALDDLVILGLIQISKSNNFFSREIEFTQAEFLRLLGWPATGQSRTRLKESLFRLKNINYFFGKAWWNTELQQWTTHGFNLIDNVDVVEPKSENAKKLSVKYRLRWNEVVFESFENGFLRSINFELCKQLSSIGLALYRFTQKNFHHSPILCLNLLELTRNGLGLLSKFDGIAHHIRAIEPAIHKLEKAGELEPLKKTERFFRDGTTWMIRLVKTGHNWRKSSSHQAKGAPNPLDSISLPLVGELIAKPSEPTPRVVETTATVKR